MKNLAVYVKITCHVTAVEIRHRRQLHGPRYVHTGGDTGRHGHHDGYELVRVRVVAGRPGRRADRALSAQGGAPPLSPPLLRCLYMPVFLARERRLLSISYKIRIRSSEFRESASRVACVRNMGNEGSGFMTPPTMPPTYVGCGQWCGLRSPAAAPPPPPAP